MEMQEYRQRAQAQLAELLNPKPYFRQMAIDNLDRLKKYDPEVIERLREIATADDHPDVRAAAARCAERLSVFAGVKDHDIVLQLQQARLNEPAPPEGPRASDRTGGAEDADRVPCPYCAESIRPQAFVCRYCHNTLPAGVAAGMRPTPVVVPGVAAAPALPQTPTILSLSDGQCPNCRGFTTLTEENLRKQAIRGEDITLGRVVKSWTWGLLKGLFINVIWMIPALFIGVLVLESLGQLRNPNPPFVWVGGVVVLLPLLRAIFIAIRTTQRFFTNAAALAMTDRELTHLHSCELCGYKWDDREPQEVNPNPSPLLSEKNRRRVQYAKHMRWIEEGRCAECGAPTTSKCPICKKPHCERHIADTEYTDPPLDKDDSPRTRRVRQGSTCYHRDRAS